MQGKEWEAYFESLPLSKLIKLNKVIDSLPKIFKLEFEGLEAVNYIAKENINDRKRKILKKYY